MAFSSSSLLLVLTVSAIIASAQAVAMGGILGGTLLCTNTSLSQVGTYNVIANARMDVVCGNGSAARVLRSAVTDLAGVYLFTFTTADTILNDPGMCYLTATIPPNSCTFNIPNGSLRMPIGLLETIDALTGSILIMVPGTLSYLLN